MAGHRHNPADGDYGTGAARASETTSIHLTPVTDEPTITPRLSSDERNSVEALPAGSALLVAHSGPNAGARFLLDSDVTTAAATRMRTSSWMTSRYRGATWSSGAPPAASKWWTRTASTAPTSTTTAWTAWN